MAEFTRVIRSHRKSQAHLGNDDYRLEAGSSTALADRPLAAARPLGLPDRSPATRRTDVSVRKRPWRARQRSQTRLAVRPDESPDLQSSGGHTGNSSLLRAAFPPDKFGLGADCTDTQLLDAVDQSWLSARGYVVSGDDAGLPGNECADECLAPQRVKVAIPGRIDPKDEARFNDAFEAAASQLPPEHTQTHLDACAYQAWCECFGPPVALSARDKVWASVPTWCWVDEPFCQAFATLCEALPDNCTDQQLAAALNEAWEASQGDNWQ